MADYPIDRVMAFDKQVYQAIDKLLAEEGIKRDPNLDYTCAMYDEEGEIIATGSCFANSLRCLAVSSAHQGEGLMNSIVTHTNGVIRISFCTLNAIPQSFSRAWVFMKLHVLKINWCLWRTNVRALQII